MDKMALNFMWYVLFGIRYDVAKEHKDEALEKCAKSAYRDLRRTLAYSTSVNDLEGSKDSKQRQEYIEKKRQFRDEVVKDILFRIDWLLKNWPTDFDDWHKTTCQAIISMAKKRTSLFKEDAFFYGQAQKWLNMTLKNMVVMGLWDEDDNFRAIKSSLHVPVDSYIMEAASKLDDSIPIPRSDNKAAGKYSPGASKPWSQWGENEDGKNEYELFQAALREAIINKSNATSPIEWESTAWISIAEKRKEAEEEKEKMKREKRIST
jgi:hypothetical protein